jgi:hypothetical protein
MNSPINRFTMPPALVTFLGAFVARSEEMTNGKEGKAASVIGRVFSYNPFTALFGDDEPAEPDDAGKSKPRAKPKPELAESVPATVAAVLPGSSAPATPPGTPAGVQIVEVPKPAPAVVAGSGGDTSGNSGSNGQVVQ